MLRIALRGLAVLAMLGLPSLTLFACVQPPALVIETSTGDVVRLESWTTPLEPISSEVGGTATLEPGSTYRETRATVAIPAQPRGPPTPGSFTSASAVTSWAFSPGQWRTRRSWSMPMERARRR